MACIKSHPARCLTSWLNQTSYDTVWFKGCQRTSRLPTGKDRGVITIEGHGLVWTVVVGHPPVVRTTRSYPVSHSLRMNHSHFGQILSGLMTGVTLLLIVVNNVKSEEARICAVGVGYLLGPAINCTSGYLINVTGAEYLDLNSSLCGINVCPCDHVLCREDVDTVDNGRHYNSIIRHCQYKPRCTTGTLPRKNAPTCKGPDMLLIYYTCVHDLPFPDTPTTSSQTSGTSGSPATPATSGSSSQDDAVSGFTDPGTTRLSTATNGLTETASVNPESDPPAHIIAIAAGASAGAVVIIIVIVVAVICVKRRQAKSPMGGNDYQNDRAGVGHPNDLVMGPVATVEPYSETIVGRPDGPPGGPPGGPPAAEYSYAAVPDRLADMPRGDGAGDDGQDKDPTYSVAGPLGDNRETVATPTGAQKAAVPDVYSQVKLREPRLSKREVVSDHLDVTENAIYGEPLT